MATGPVWLKWQSSGLLVRHADFDHITPPSSDDGGPLEIGAADLQTTAMPGWQLRMRISGGLTVPKNVAAAMARRWPGKMAGAQAPDMGDFVPTPATAAVLLHAARSSQPRRQ